MRILIILFLALLPLPARSETIHDRPALWKVSDTDTTIWLFGTIHLLGPDHQWLEGKVAKAFGGAQELVVETRIPDAETTQAIVLRHAVDPAGRRLAQILPPALHARLIARMEALGLPAEALETVEPWYASMLLQMVAYQKLGLAPDNGVDVKLIAQAERTGETIVPLEGFEEQISFFDAMPEKLQLAMLDSTLGEIENSAELLRQMIRNWSAGDVVALAALINDDLDQMPELRAILLDRRNARWADWIEKRLDRPGKAFVAVGAGHLGGKGNVRELLEAKGYEVERVQ